MRYMFIIKNAQNGAPNPALAEAMHALAEREVRAGRMIQDGGLTPPAAGAEVRIAKRKLMITDGPFTETKEVIGGYAIFELPDRDAAIASAVAFMDLHLQHIPDWEGTCEIRQIAGSQVELILGAAKSAPPGA